MDEQQQTYGSAMDLAMLIPVIPPTAA